MNLLLAKSRKFTALAATVFLAGWVSGEPVPLPQQIANETAAVASGSTPADWIRQHPAETLEPYSGKQLANDTETWCVRTVVRHPDPQGQTWSRTVYFYEPAPPPDDSLPPPGTPAEKLRESSCRLGLVWIEVPETDKATGAALARSIETAFAARLGAGEATRLPGGFGSAGWVETRRWHVGHGLLTVAYDQFGGIGRRAIVRLAFPNSDAIHDEDRETEEAHAELTAECDALVQQVRDAQLPEAATREMLALCEHPDFFSAQNLPSEAQVVGAFRSWITAASRAPAGQQAMALIAADRVLYFLDHNGVQPGEAGRAQMKQMGAAYVNNELAGGPVYAHGLLKRAAAIAPPGPAADEVLLAQMERGFDETGMCSAGAEEYSQVVQKGEALLAGSRSLPTSTLASAHFMIADAYATIVWLASPADTDYHDPKKYEAAAPAARYKALEHYRAALRLEHGTPRAQKAWRTAWRLAAGLPPKDARYFCVYD